METYTVYFLVKELLSVQITASNEKEAKEKAEKILDNEKRKNGITCVDGITEFAGYNIDRCWNELY